MTALFPEARMIRHLAGADQGSLVINYPDRPVHLPPFEREYVDMLTANYDGESAIAVSD